jgi:hypothetical protein
MTTYFKKFKLGGLLVLILGLVTSAVLVTQQQLFKNRAFTPGPTTSTHNLFLSPVSGTVQAGDIVPVQIKFRTENPGDQPRPISALAVKVNFPSIPDSITGVRDIQVVDANGNASYQAYEHRYPNYTGSGELDSNWSFPFKGVTYTSNQGSLELSAAYLSANSGFSTSGNDQVLATLYLKFNRPPTGNTLTLTIDPVETKMYTKQDNLEIQDIAQFTTYTVAAVTTPPPVESATLSFSPNSGPISTSQDTVVTASLNTGNASIDGFQFTGSYTYTGTQPPIDITGTSLTNLTSGLNCLTNTITHSPSTQTISFALACVIPPADPAIPFTTNGAAIPVFSFNLHPLSTGDITLIFNNQTNRVVSHTTGSNILTSISNVTYSAALPTPTPSNEVSLTFDPSAANLPASPDTVVTAYLNTGSNEIAGYQLSASYSYTSSQPPIDIIGTSLNPLDPALTCLSNAINHNAITKTVSFSIACGIPLSDPPTPYSTNGQRKAIFTFQLHPLSSGQVSIAFNPQSTKVISYATGSNILPATPTNLNYTFGTFSSEAQLNFKVRFQGINPNTPNLPAKNIRVTLRQAGQQDLVYIVSAQPDANNDYVYSGQDISVPTGIYDVLIKGPVHMQKLFSGVNLGNVGINTLDFSSTVLKAGDMAPSNLSPWYDNVIDIVDYGVLSTNFQSGVIKTSTADLNNDGYVDIIDYGLLSANFNSGVYGDQ